MIKQNLESLIHYGLSHQFFRMEDVHWMRGSLCAFLNMELYDEKEVKLSSSTVDIADLLSQITDWAHEKGLIPSVLSPYNDLFDTALMGILCPRPSEVAHRFWNLFHESPQKATDWYYKFSQATHYIRMDRMAKNIQWHHETDFGQLVITVNLSKPEKDPMAIAAAAQAKEVNFPKCLLCIENVGYSGDLNQPPRQNHRIIPLTLNNEKWFMQYSPYIYYNEHAIIINQKHVPMAIGPDTFKRLCDFVSQFEHYFIGSNADLPLVGGSMLSHDHYQGGHFDMPMAKAAVYKSYGIKGFEAVQVSWLKWPLTVLRLSHQNRHLVEALAAKITDTWRYYSSPEDELISYTGNEPHHTVTPIARKRHHQYEIDVVLRDNRRSERYPDGIYHPHAEVHPVKKENIGLIEVMGLAVLPSRIKATMEVLEEALQTGTHWAALEERPEVSGFEALYDEMWSVKASGKSSGDSVRQVIGDTFTKGLLHAGVMQNDAQGTMAMERFIQLINQQEAE